MKSKAALVLLLALIAAALWYLGERVRLDASSNSDFLALYQGAKTVRTGQPLYSPVKVEKAPAPAPAAEGVPAPQITVAPEAAEAPSTPEATETVAMPQTIVSVPAPETTVPAAGPEAAAPPETPVSTGAPGGAEKHFGYLPYLAYILLPLTFLDAPSAALAWYWFNVALVVVALLLSAATLAGGLVPASRGLLLIPAFVVAPFLAHFLSGASVSILALVFVLAGLGLFRRGADVAAGLVSSIAVFSPLGVAIGAYWFLKRAWSAAIPFLLGAAILLLLVPMISLGPAGSWQELGGFYESALVPYLWTATEPAPFMDTDNQSMWPVLMCHDTTITDLSERARTELNKAFKVNIPKLPSDYMVLVLMVAGGLFLLVTALAVARRLIERDLAVVGIEGALVVIAVLVLSLRTHFDAMATLIFPVAACVYVIRNSDIRRIVHHVNYVGLVTATAAFYMSLHPRFQAPGIALGGVVVLWIALLLGIYRFRPKTVHGRASASFRKREKELARPIDLVEIKSDAEKATPKGTGLLPMPDFTARAEELRVVTPREERRARDVRPIELEEEPGEDKKKNA